MSDFEKGVLFVEFLNTANVIFASYMTLLFAVLTASWLLAKRMSWPVAIWFLTLFTIAAIALGSGAYFAFSDFFALQSYIVETAAPAGDLRWLGPMRTQAAPNLFATQLVMLGILVSGWAGGCGFFLIVRYGQRTANPAAPS